MKPYYEQDGITIYHGDCREILPTTERIGLLLSDPPFGIGYVGTSKPQRVTGRPNAPRHLATERIRGDDAPFDPSHLLGISDDVILWGAHHFSDRLPVSHGWLVWDKLDGVTPSSFADAELAWHQNSNATRLFRYLWRGICQAGEKGKRLHPNQKPVSLMRWCIDRSKATGVVCDPYLGSGAVLVAAKDLGRRAIGIEIEERYCEIAAQRLSQQVLDFGEAA